MLNQHLHILGLDCVEHIEKILPRWVLAIRVFRAKVLSDFWISFDFIPDLVDCQFFVLWYSNELYLCHLKELSFVSQKFFDELLGELIPRWHIVAD